MHPDITQLKLVDSELELNITANATLSRSFDIIDTNLAFEKSLGYSKKELTGMNLRNLIHPDDFENNLYLYNQLLSGNLKEIHLTQRIINTGSKVEWIHASILSVNNTNSNQEVYNLKIQDVNLNIDQKSDIIKYSDLIENANEGIAIYDNSLKMLFCNPAMYKSLGYSKDEFLNIDHSKLSLYHPNDIADFKKMFQKVLQGNKETTEKRIIDKEGKIRYFSSEFVPVLHQNKSYVAVFRREITDKVSSDKNNEEYREFLETFIDNIPVPIYAKSLSEQRYLFWNKTSEKTFALSSDEVIGYNDHEICIPKEYKEKSISDDAVLMCGNNNIRSEVEFINNKGEKKSFINFKSIIQLPIGEKLILGAGIDVSDLRVAESKVEQSGYIIKEAQKIAKLGYWEYDIDKDLIFDNTENRQIYGIHNDDHFLSLNDFLKILDLPSKNELSINFERCKKSKTNCEQIIRIQNQDNSSKYVMINFKPTTNSNGDVIKIKGTSIDITRIKKTESAIQEFGVKLRQTENIAKTGHWEIDYTNKTTQFSNEIWNLMCKSPLTEGYSVKDISQNIHPDDKDLFFKLFSNNNSNPFEQTFRVIAGDGEIKYIKVQGTNVINSEKITIKSIGIFKDITDLKKVEIENEALKNTLEEIQKHSNFANIKLTSGSIPEIIDKFTNKQNSPGKL